jgi:hypothetical protein
MNLFDLIDQEMQADILEGNEDSGRKSERLLNTYRDATPASQDAINDMFISLTGWSFATLIEKHKERRTHGF